MYLCAIIQVKVCLNPPIWHSANSCLLFPQATYACSSGCGYCGSYTTGSGTLSDGSVTWNYASNTTCEWMIVVPSSSVTMNFYNVDTQAGKDFVRVWQCSDLACTQQLQLAEMSGLGVRDQIMTSTTGFMKVSFTSDASVNFEGFYGTWTSVRPLITLLMVFTTQTLSVHVCMGYAQRLFMKYVKGTLICSSVLFFVILDTRYFLSDDVSCLSSHVPRLNYSNRA
jgi:hypothetical protein